MSHPGGGRPEDSSGQVPHPYHSGRAVFQPGTFQQHGNPQDNPANVPYTSNCPRLSVPGPPGNLQHPSENTQYSPGDFQRPLGDFQHPPGDFQCPPGNFQYPPADFQRPPVDFHPPPGYFQHPPRDFQCPLGNIRHPFGDIRHPSRTFQGSPGNLFQRPPGVFRRHPGNFQYPPRDFHHPPRDFQCPPRNFQRPPGNVQRPTGNFQRHPDIQHLPGDSWYAAGNLQHPSYDGTLSYTGTSSGYPSMPQGFHVFNSPTQNLNPSGGEDPGISLPPPSRNFSDPETQLRALTISSTTDSSQDKNVSDGLSGPEKKKMKIQKGEISIPTKGAAFSEEETSTQIQIEPAESTTPPQLETEVTDGFAISCLSPTPQRPPFITEAYSAEQKYFFRLISIHSHLSKKILHNIFVKGHRRFFDQKPRQTLHQYYEDNGVIMKSFWGNLNPTQRKMINADPEGWKFDVTLLFTCIQHGSDDVEHKDLEKWKVNEQNPSLESYLTSIKNARNNIFHNFTECDKKTFVDETNRLGELFENAIESAGNRYHVCPEDIKKEVSSMYEELIAFRDKPFQSQNLEDYMKEVPFDEFSNYVNLEGKKELCRQYEKMKRINITPVNHLADIKFHVKDIYTQMVLKGTMSQDIRLEDMLQNTSEDEAVSYDDQENIPQDASIDRPKHLFLLEGIAGSGKTTLSKKILEDWMHPYQSAIKDINIYDFLLHTECRNRSIQSFIGLVQTLMPKSSRKFRPEDFYRIILCQRILILFDGLDEINDQSAKLFQEILEIMVSHNIDVMVTTRPEKIEYYFRLVESLQLETKHIELLGIPGDKRNDFVCKYHSEMKRVRCKEDIPSIERLLEYLSRSQYRLDDLWRLPYNLALLVILWVHNPSVVNNITTSSELYWEIHLLSLLKLKERLSRHSMTMDLDEWSLEHKVDYFIKSLCKEAMVGLVKDDINLAGNSLQEIIDVCIKEKIPGGEMIGAFLKKATTITEYGYKVKLFSYPHKGLQDFLGALHIFSKFQDEWKKFGKKEKVIMDYLTELHGCKEMDIAKFQNLLIILIGVVYLHQHKPQSNRLITVDDKVKIHILDLLRDTGISSAESWLKILDSVRCDEFVATYISRISKIKDKPMAVNDSSIFAYISLLSAFSETTDVGKNLKMNLDLKDHAGFSDLLPHMTRLKISVEQIKFEKDVIKFLSTFPYEDAMNDMFQRNPTMKEYRGPLTLRMVLPTSPHTLFVTIPDEEVYKSFNDFLKSLKVNALTHVTICFKKCFDWKVLEPLPYEKFHSSTVYIVGVDSEEAVENVWKIMNRLRPYDGKKGRRSRMAFPNASMTEEMVKSMNRKRKSSDFLNPPIALPSCCSSVVKSSYTGILCVKGKDNRDVHFPLINENWLV